MTSQPWKKTIAIHILSNISRRKNNLTKKFGQLIEYNIEIFFFQNHSQHVVVKPVTEPFIKNQN